MVMRIFWRPSVVSCLALAAAAGVTAACSGLRNEARYGTASPRVVDPTQPIPKGGGTYKLGAPYQIDGRWYVPQEEPGYDRTGLASALYVASIAKGGEEAAEGQLSLRFGHVSLPFVPEYAMDQTWESLEPWLGFGDS